MAQGSAEVYVEELAPKGYGIPIWRAGEDVQIGDVGLLYCGNFFPVSDRGSSSVTFRNHETDLDVLPPCIISSFRTPSSYSGSVLCTHLASKSKPKFSDGKTRGAFLQLEGHSSRETVRANQDIERYIYKHLHEWYKIAAKDMSLPCEEQDLLIVTGCTKTKGMWHKGVAWILDGKVDEDILANHAPEQLAYFEPPSRSLHPSSTEDREQCVLFTAYRMKRRASPDILRGLKNIFRNLSRGYEVVSLPKTSYHTPSPSLDVLDYILKHCDAEAAIASEQSIEELLKGNEWPADMASFLEQTRPEVEVVDGKFGRLKQVMPHQPSEQLNNP